MKKHKIPKNIFVPLVEDYKKFVNDSIENNFFDDQKAFDIHTKIASYDGFSMAVFRDLRTKYDDAYKDSLDFVFGVESRPYHSLLTEYKKFVDSSIKKNDFDFDKAVDYLLSLSKIEVVLYAEIIKLTVSFYEASKFNKENSFSNIEAVNAIDKFLDGLIDIAKDKNKKSLIDFKAFFVFIDLRDNDRVFESDDLDTPSAQEIDKIVTFNLNELSKSIQIRVDEAYQRGFANGKKHSSNVLNPEEFLNEILDEPL